MNQQIIKIITDPKDQKCLLITLRISPNRFKFWGKQTSTLITYKGYGRNWYCLPDYQPAPKKLIPLLKEISRGPEFRHLRTKI